MRGIKHYIFLITIGVLLLVLSSCGSKVITVDEYKLIKLSDGYAIEELPNEVMNQITYEVPEMIGEYKITQLGYERESLYGPYVRIRFGNIRKLVIGSHIDKFEATKSEVPLFLVLDKTLEDLELKRFEVWPHVYILGPKSAIEDSRIVYIDQTNIYENFIVHRYEDSYEITYYFGNEEVNIPSIIHDLPVTSIKSRAFYRANIESVLIPGTIETMGEYTFADNKNLKSIEILDGVKEIGKNAFSNVGSESLEPLLVKLPETLTQIQEHAFFNSYLRDIKLPDSIETIAYGAFSQTKIEVLTLPKNLEYLNQIINHTETLKALHINESLRVFNMEMKNSQWSNLELITVDAKNTRFYVENGMLQDESYIYLVVKKFKQREITIDKKVEPYAFSDVVGLEKITILNGESITRASFAYMPDLKEVILPKGLIRIEQAAFFNNNKLSTINLANIKRIDQSAFTYCSALEVVNLDSIESIGDYAFEHSGLKEIKIPKSCRTIGIQAFADAKALSKVSFEDRGVVNIMNEAFFNTPYGDKNKN